MNPKFVINSALDPKRECGVLSAYKSFKHPLLRFTV